MKKKRSSGMVASSLFATRPISVAITRLASASRATSAGTAVAAIPAAASASTSAGESRAPPSRAVARNAPSSTTA
jgi:hypothetical protein